MIIYNYENAVQKVTEIKNSNKKFITKISKDIDLVNWINNWFIEQYPNNSDELFVGKIWFLLHPTESLYCECGLKKKLSGNKYCGNYRCIRWCSFNKDKTKRTNLERFGTEYASSSLEIKYKVKQTCLKNWGVDYSLQSKIVKEKGKKTNLEKYGKEYASQNLIIKNKIKETNLEKYGYESVFSSLIIKEKIKGTNLEKYGYENPQQNKHVQDKTKKTNLEKYGTEYAYNSKEINNKVKKTCKEKYGQENPLSSEVIKEKVKKTNLEKYGYESPSYKHLSQEAVTILLSKDLFSNILENMSAKEMAKYLGVGVSTIYRWHKRHKLHIFNGVISSWESEILRFLEENNILYKHPDREQLRPKELDFYFENKNLGLELNGDYWHMNPEIYKSTDLNKKIKKTAQEIWDKDELKAKLCKERNIKLIIIWESDWYKNKDKWKEKLLKLLK